MLVLLPILLLAAQDGASAATPAPAPVSRAKLQTFIAPSGEPFRVPAGQPYPVAQWFAAADKNGDGKLDYTEFNADFMRFFNLVDADHDGAIDGAEKAQYENTIAPETLGSSWTLDSRREEEAEQVDFQSDDEGAVTLTRPKPAYGTHPIGAARFDLLGIPEPVAAMDVRIRGRISRNDADQSARTRFLVLDPQHRGYLTLDTLPLTFAQSHRVRTK